MSGIGRGGDQERRAEDQGPGDKIRVPQARVASSLLGLTILRCVVCFMGRGLEEDDGGDGERKSGAVMIPTARAITALAFDERTRASVRRFGWTCAVVSGVPSCL